MAYLDGLSQSTGTPPSSMGGPALTAPAPAPQEAPAAGAAPDSSESFELTEEKLTSLPPVAAVIAGNPPGVSFPERAPAAAILAANLPKLTPLGLSLFRSNSAGFVLFNEKLLPATELKTLDKQGKLGSVVQPAQSIGPVKGTPAPAPDQAAPPAPALAPPMPSAPLPARAQTRLVGTRLQALMPQPPTGGPVPGQGRVLSGLLARTV